MERQKNGSRWWAMAVIGMAQLMVVLDATIVNIALPSIQAELGLSDGNRQWVITAYALAFGGLLLPGGRVSSLLGHRRSFLVGLAGFAAASVLGGAADGAGMLFTARALQGVFAAILAPAALSLLTMTFTEPRERGKAFGVFAAVGAGGSALGMVAGGLLTEHVDWRWCLYVNVPIAALALLGGPLLMRDDAHRGPKGLDLPGVLLSAGGLVALVYGFNEAESRGWGDPLVLGMLIGGLLLLGLFVLLESRVRHPLLPLRVLAHRTRGGALLSIGLSQVAMFGFYLFMTYYLQAVLGYSPVRAGAAFLLTAAGVVVGSTLIAGTLLPRMAPRTLLVPGLLAAAAGMLILTRLTAESPNVFLLYLLPAQILIGVGLGCVMTPATSLATAEVDPSDAGIASAAFNASQQLGGALGTALLNTVAASVAATYLAGHERTPRAVAEGTVHGFSVALTIAVLVLICTAVVTGLLINVRKPEPRNPVPAEEEPPLPSISR
ncbi:MFS transporter [Amycolatopsis nigrescens]|uniref:MFS transporter n=1 Tax=Amycolatopsis nigrescens TaxID=381445 RepID=UPI0003A85EB8|nr:MFS transporter [Amycolatopsis nigrescens]